jgi:hypothetical protein
MAGHHPIRVKFLLALFALTAVVPFAPLQAQGFHSGPGAPVTTASAPVFAPPAAVTAPLAVPVAPVPTTVVATPVAIPAPPIATVASNSGAYNSGAFSSVSGSGPNVPTAEPAAANFGAGSTGGFEMAEKVLVIKSERKLYLLRRGRVIKEYPIKLGLNPFGHKQREGDFRTPEGKYELVARNPRSEFFLSIKISYPNREDAAVAGEAGFPPGGLIMIHGQPNVPKKSPEHYATRDWTDGCIALSNSDMVDVWMRTTVGIPIEIRP